MMSAQIILLLPFDSKQQIFRNAAQQIFRNHQPAGCRCPPPTIIPRAQASDRPRVCTGRPCPRCSGALCSLRVQQTELLACERCFGTFLSNEAVLRLDGPLGASLRGTQKQPATVAPGPVRYIPCVTCRQLMNRQVFARISGVIVDVCKDHGVWFDTGELEAVIEFIEAGGLEAARERATLARLADRRELLRRFQHAHVARTG
jgi:Zn-finger nucleic acid-binding protein